MTRIISGTAGGRRLATPTGADTRPTSDRVREGLFSRLEHLDVLAGARVLDLYAGSGALGLEAASRGAAAVVLVEVDRATAGIARDNVATLGLDQRVAVRAESVERGLLGAPPQPYDLVLLDPPYDFADWDGLLARLVPSLAERAVVVVESDREVAVAPHLRVIRSKRYGSTVVLFAALPGAPS